MTRRRTLLSPTRSKGHTRMDDRLLFSASCYGNYSGVVPHQSFRLPFPVGKADIGTQLGDM